ncbi:MAG TPA: lipopolysaccharide heptosyltransferase I [Planctomycetota bacterium]|nr:lipopolysaccharide heptosyltransferase I [Planctomycetota bacterium]
MESQRILVVKPSSLGDVVHSLPFLHVVRRGFPEARIAWVISRANADLLEGHPDVDEVVVFERERWGGMKDCVRSMSELSHFVRRLRRGRYDVAVDLQGLLRSGLVSYLSGAPRRVGFADARELSSIFYNVHVDVPDVETHAVDRCLLVARGLGLELNGRPVFDVAIGSEARTFADDYLASANPEGRPVVVTLPFSRWATKRWPAARFAALAERVQEGLGAAVVVLGGRGDAALAQRMHAPMTRAPLDLVGRTTLKQSAALLERADVVVSGDTGPMHLAVALGRPVVALYGPTSTARTGPYDGTARVLRSTRACAPCLRAHCPDPDCMTDIAVDDVLDAVRQFLETSR